MEKCMSCQFYDRKSAAGEARSPQWGQCRRTSPMLSPLTAKAYMIEGVWPTVRDDDWCGEWKSPASRRIGDPLASPLSAKGPVVAPMPRVSPLTVGTASAIGAGTLGTAAAMVASVPATGGD